MALTPRERKAALLLAGRTQYQLAEEAGVSTGLVSLVMNDRLRNAHVEAVIAKALARPREAVFPDRATGAHGSLCAAGAAL